MLSCWHDLLCLFFCLLLFYILLPSIGWLYVVGVFGLIECSRSLQALHSGLQIIIIIIIIKSIVKKSMVQDTIFLQVKCIIKLQFTKLKVFPLNNLSCSYICRGLR